MAHVALDFEHAARVLHAAFPTGHLPWASELRVAPLFYVDAYGVVCGNDLSQESLPWDLRSAAELWESFAAHELIPRGWETEPRYHCPHCYRGGSACSHPRVLPDAPHTLAQSPWTPEAAVSLAMWTPAQLLRADALALTCAERLAPWFRFRTNAPRVQWVERTPECWYVPFGARSSAVSTRDRRWIASPWYVPTDWPLGGLYVGGPEDGPPTIYDLAERWRSHLPNPYEPLVELDAMRTRFRLEALLPSGPVLGYTRMYWKTLDLHHDLRA